MLHPPSTAIIIIFTLLSTRHNQSHFYSRYLTMNNITVSYITFVDLFSRKLNMLLYFTDSLLAFAVHQRLTYFSGQFYEEYSPPFFRSYTSRCICNWSYDQLRELDVENHYNYIRLIYYRVVVYRVIMYTK
jgi:hypothetical protein